MVNQLNPQGVWKNFAAINAIPRASKKEEKIAAYVAQFGTDLGLEVIRDEFGNVIIKKPAQNSNSTEPVILQSHLDMVHQKNSDTSFDFDTEGIRMYIDGEWVKAEGTTLGADNGIGAACMMGLLENKEISHPPLEALFTLDEEAGMSGAKNLGQGILTGKKLLNLDTEDEKEITIGCAGGIDTNVSMDLTMEATPDNTKAYYLSVKGLSGGHSGMDIHLGKGNANKILFRFLLHGYSQFGMRLASADGGGLRNAIPREAFATVVVDIQQASAFEKHVETLGAEIKAEFSNEPKLTIGLETTANPVEVIGLTEQVKIVRAIQSAYNGVYRMSPDIEGLVEASTNLARVLISNGKFECLSLQRSSVESSKMDIANTIGSAFEQIGAQVTFKGDYPGWKPNPKSDLLDKSTAVYREVFQKDPEILACHAGLECGIINGRYPGLDMISIGPTIRNPHSPDEKVHIGSVERFWKFLLQLISSL